MKKLSETFVVLKNTWILLLLPILWVSQMNLKLFMCLSSASRRETVWCATNWRRLRDKCIQSAVLHSVISICTSPKIRTASRFSTPGSITVDCFSITFDCLSNNNNNNNNLYVTFKKLAPLFHPIRSKTKTNRDSLVHVFPRFASATCNYFVFWLVHLIICVLCDWLEWLLWFWFYDTQLKTALSTR